MANLVDSTYFTGLIALDFSQPAIEAQLNEYCAYCEREYLISLLGADAYKDFVTAPTQTKWVNFVKAEWVQVNEVEYYKDVKKMLARFIFFRYANDMNYNTTSIGHIVVNTEGSNKLLPVRQLVDVYNASVYDFNKLADYVRENELGKPEKHLERINYLGI